MSKFILLAAVLSFAAFGCQNKKHDHDGHAHHAHVASDGGSPQPNTVSDKPSTRPGQMQMGK